MIRKFIQKLSSSVMGGAVIIGLAAVLSRVVGLWRDHLLAREFAGTATIDIYNAAFKVPDLLFNILVLGALSAAFIPVFIETKTKHDEATAFNTANAVLNLLGLAIIVALVISWLTAPVIAHWLLYSRPLEQQADAITLMRVMLLSILFFGVSNVVSGILNSYRRFITYALAPILYNLGIIVGVIWLYPIYGIMGLGYGVVLGAAGHLLVQLPMVWRLGYRYRWITNLNIPGVRTILRLMPPRALALGIVQINALVIAAMALRLPEGSLGIWTWADNLQQFPINVFGVSLALSAFPVFSQAFADNDMAKFKKVFSNNFRRILFLVIPVSLATLLLRAQIVRLVLGSFNSGRFDWTATVMTAQVLGFFAVAMFAQATIPLLARSFFAHHDTKTPVVISLITIVSNIILAVCLVQPLGLYGLAMAFSMTSLLNMLLLLFGLRLKFGDLDDNQIIRSVWRILAATLVMGLVIHGMKYFIAPLVDMQTTVGLFVQSLGSVVAGGLVYLGIAWYFKFSELDIIKQYLSKIRQVIYKAR